MPREMYLLAATDYVEFIVNHSDRVSHTITTAMWFAMTYVGE